MKIIIFSFTAILLLLTFVFLNIGKWIDVTEEPVNADIIVCLGGGTLDRVKKSIELLEQEYSWKQVFLLIGESWYNQPYIKKNHPDINIIIDESPKNTKEEVLFIKEYMKKHNYKSALIVTSPPHSGRVKLLTLLISVEGDENMTFHMIASEVKWWDAEHYYRSEQARGFVLHEVMGMVYEVVIGNWCTPRAFPDGHQ